MSTINPFDDVDMDGAELSAPSLEVENPFDGFADEMAQEREQRRRAAAAAARDVNPDEYAKGVNSAAALGLPETLAEHPENRRELTARADEMQFSDWLSRRSKELLGVFSEDPLLFKVAKDDAGTLEQLETLFSNSKAAFRKGNALSQAGLLSWRELTGEITDREKTNLDRARELIRMQPPEAAQDSLWEEIALNTGELTGQMFSPILRSLEFGLAAGTAVGAAGAVTGAGTAAALPAAGAGVLASAARDTFMIEAGLAWDEFREFRTEDGLELDPEVARGAAMFAGLVNSAIEVGGLALLGQLTGMTELLQKVSRGGLRQALKSTTVRRALGRFATATAAVPISETGQEILQEWSVVAAGELAKELSPGQFENITTEEFVERTVEIARKTMTGTLPLGAVGASPALVSDIRAAQRAQENKQFFDTLAGTSTDSKLRERMPARYQRVLDAMANGTEYQNVYVSPAPLVELFQSQGGTVEDIYNELPSLRDQLEPALASNTPVEIPIGEFAAKIAGTEAYQALAGHVKLDSHGFTVEEAKLWEANNKTDFEREAQYALDNAEQVAASEEPADRIYQEIEIQLKGAGVRETQPAALYRAFFKTMGERIGVDPFELYQQNQVVVQSELTKLAAQKQVGRIDLALDRVRSGRAPAQRDVYGPSILQRVRELTGRREVPTRTATGEESLFDLDALAQQMADEGYLDTPDAGALLAAVEQEQAGDPVFSPANYNERMDEEAQDTADLADMLSALEIDLETTSNEEVKAMLEGVRIAQAPDGQVLLQKEGDGRDLIVTHNLSAANVLHAEKMGGIPVPSLAITKAESPLTGFGEITLIGPPDMADPKGYAGVKVFGSDVYSPRYPSVSYNIDSKTSKAIKEKFGKAEEAVGGPVDLSEAESNGADALENSAAVMYQFLKERRKKPQVTTRTPIQENELAFLDKYLSKWEGKQDFQELGRDPEFQDAVLNGLNEQIPEEAADARFDLEDQDVRHRLGMKYARLVSIDAEQGREGRPDEYGTRNALRERLQNEGLTEKFSEWVNDFWSSLNVPERLFEGYTYSGNRRYKAHTLDNVVAKMKKDMRGGEGFNYGAGNIRAKVTPQFRSIKAIRDSKDKLVTSESLEAFKEESNEEAAALGARVGRALRLDTGNEFIAMDRGTEFIGDVASMGWGRAIREWGADPEDLSDSLREDVAEFLDKLRNAPTEYFEAVIPREVDLAEFTAAVVPRGAPKRAVKVLKDRGLKVTYYDKGDENSRAQAVQKAATGGKLLFQSSTPKVTNTPEFKRWFGDSKVVDENGEPLVVYKSEAVDSVLSGKPAVPESSVDGLRGNAELIANLLQGPTFRSEGLSGFDAPTQRVVLAAVRSFGLNSKVRRAVVELVPVDVVNVLARKEATADGLFSDDAVLQDLLSADSDGSVATAVDVADALVAAVTRVAAKDSGLVRLFGGTRKDAPASRALYGYLAVPTHDLEFKGIGNRGTTGNRGTFDPNDPSILNQENRGSILLPADPTQPSIINLFQKQNLSTFLHESGHFFLNTFERIAAQPNAPEAVRNDYATVRAWLGAAPGQELTREQHEQFARGFEAYLFEGKSPSAELEGVFATFRAWLVSVYRTIRGLDVELTDDVRGVLDRMLASEDAIEAAQARVDARPMAEDLAKAFSLDKRKTDTMVRMAADAKEEALRDLEQRTLRSFTREQRKREAELRKELTPEVEAQVDARPVYQVTKLLQTGELNGRHFKDIKLNRDAVVRVMGGSEILARLPGSGRTNVYTVQGGSDPDFIASLFGQYSSGEEMLLDMVNAPPRREAIKAELDARIRQELGDPLGDGTLAQEAADALRNNRRAQLLQAELEVLRGQVDGMAVPPASVMRDTAKKIMARSKVRFAKEHVFANAEAKAARAAVRALVSGDYAEAAKQKRAQLLNLYLAKEARAVNEEVDKALRLTKRLTKKSTREKMSQEYLDQIDAILDRFQFKRITGIELRRKDALQKWVQDRLDEGLAPAVDDNLLNEARRENYQNITVEEFRGVIDGLKSISWLGRRHAELLALQEKRRLDELADELRTAAEASGLWKELPPVLGRGTVDNVKGKLELVHAEHLRPEHALTALDKEAEGGVWWRSIFKPLADAEDAEFVLMQQMTQGLDRLFGLYSLGERSRMYSQRKHFARLGDSLTKAEQLMVALNWGNEGNRVALIEGREGWTADGVLSVLETLDERDWQFVQGTWDLVNSLWPQIADLQREMSGVVPEKVEGAPILTRYGVMPGGYFPLKFDPKASYKAFQRDEKQSVQEAFGGNFVTPQTRKGHTIERKGSGGLPVWLDFGVITQHVGNVVHDLTHRKALIEVNKILQHSQVRDAIEHTHGRDFYRTLRPWLANVGADQSPPSTSWTRTLSRLRHGMTIMSMGFKLTTMLVQPFGFTQTVDLLGEKWAMKGLQFYRNPAQNARFILDRSQFMQNRMKTFDRDVRDITKKVGRGQLKSKAEATYLAGIGLFDMSVSMPTWWGAYSKTLAETNDEARAIAFADRAVRLSQGSGGAKDLAAIQRGGELHRIFTMFYSYFSTLYNMMARRRRLTTKAADVPRLVLSFFYLVAIPAVLPDLILGRGPDEDDDESLLWWAFKKTATYPAMGVVGLRDLVGAAESGWGYQLSPVADILRMTADTVRRTAEGDFGEVWAKNAFLATSGWFALPGRQLWLTGHYLHEVMSGEEEDFSLYEALITGARD